MNPQPHDVKNFYEKPIYKTENNSVYLAVNILALYVIFDFEFPRLGLIHIGSFDQVLVDLLQSMK